MIHCKKLILDQGGVEHTDPPFEWIEFRRVALVVLQELGFGEILEEEEEANPSQDLCPLHLSQVGC